MKKALFLDKVNEVCKLKLIEKGFRIDEKFGLTKEEIIAASEHYDVFIMRTPTVITAEMIEQFSRIKALAVAAVGTDNIDTDAAKQNLIKVINAPEAHKIAATELTMGLMLALCKNFISADNDMKNGVWERDKYIGTELYGKKLGIVGVGRIGTQVAIRAKAFGMEIFGYDIVEYEERERLYGIKYMDYESLLSKSDIVTFHVPLTELTKDMFSIREIELCKKGMLLLNLSRGQVVSPNALLDALNRKIISKAAIDVYPAEPPEFNSELLKHKNLITTPHIGAATAEAKIKVAEELAEKIVNIFKD